MRYGFSPACFFILFLLTASGCTQPAAGPAGPAADGTPVPAATAARAPDTSLAIREYVDSAARFAGTNGKTAALAAFSNRTGPFVTGDVYIYALDYNGTALALPFQPDEVGTGFRDRTDAAGKPYTEIEIQLAREGGGYVLYRYPRPGNGSAQKLKISYVRPVDDTYWIGAGIYTSGDRLVDEGLRDFISEAKDFALRNGRDAAAAEFNNLNGSFVRDDLYIFGYDYNGTVLVWPYRPDQIGVNRYNDTDPAGTRHVRAMIAAAEAGSGMVDYYSVNPETGVTQLKISHISDVDGTWFIGAGRYVEPDSRLLAA